MKFALFFLAFNGVMAQTLAVVPTGSGNSGSFSIDLAGAPGKEPVALQWTLLLQPDVTVSTKDIVAGSAAQTAQKSLVCRQLTQPKHTLEAFGCILAGGLQTISAGSVAVVKYKSHGSPKNPLARIQNGVAVTADMKKTTLKEAPAVGR